MKKDNEAKSYPLLYLNKSWDINYWCQRLNLRADELREMIKRAGPALDNVLRLVDHRK